MADNVLRLKVDSQEYDSKIKRAAEGIQHFVDNVRKSGSTLQESGIMARSFLMELGNMDTVAKGGKQQLREMSNALVTLTNTYRDLSDAEKSSGFGQELAKQIQVLTERAGQAKDAMLDVEQSIKNAASDTRLFDQLSQGASVAMAGFQGLTGAGRLLGLEMGNDVEVIAKLQAAMAVTNSLTTIQTALQKQSALMQGVQAAQTAIATAAQSAFATATGSATLAQKAFNVVANMNPYVLLTSAIVAAGAALYAFASASDEAKKKEEEQKRAAEEAQKALEDQRRAMVDASAQAGATAGYIQQLQQSYATANTEFEKTSILKQAAAEFKKLGLECKGTDDAQRLLVKEGSKVVQMIEMQGQAAALGAMRMDAYKKALSNLMKDVESGQLSLGSAMTMANQDSSVQQYTKEMVNLQGRMAQLKRGLGATGGGGRSGRATTRSTAPTYASDSIAAQEALVSDLQKKWKEAGAGVRDQYLSQLIEAEKQLKKMKDEQDILRENMQGRLLLTGKDIDLSGKGVAKDGGLFGKETERALSKPSQLSDKAMKSVEKNIEKQTKLQAKEMKDSDKEKETVAEGLGDLAGGFSQMFGGLEQLGIDIPAGLQNVVGGIQAVSSILMSIMTIVSAIQAVAAADAIIPFATGGIVRAAGGTLVGTSYSGDNLRAIGPGNQLYGLNAGEIVLNKAQAGNLASQLQGSGMQNTRLEAVVRGEQLFLAENNRGRRTGRGEIVQSRRVNR